MTGTSRKVSVNSLDIITQNKVLHRTGNLPKEEKKRERERENEKFHVSFMGTFMHRGGIGWKRRSCNRYYPQFTLQITSLYVQKNDKRARRERTEQRVSSETRIGPARNFRNSITRILHDGFFCLHLAREARDGRFLPRNAPVRLVKRALSRAETRVRGG